MENPEIIFVKEDNPKMLEAFKRAQETFKYFWRELSWEYRRVIPALDVAYVKVAFAQQQHEGESPTVEHMWVNNINFDGEQLYGVLVNEPQQLTNVQLNDEVAVPLNQVSDWLFALMGKTHGGFTIQVMRSNMDAAARQAHDEAWGLDFGDADDILLVHDQKDHPENLEEHPMSINMKEKWEEFVQENHDGITNKDEEGYNLLHREVIAGNRTMVETLLQTGLFDLEAKTNQGKTALDFAQKFNWEHIIPLLSN